MSRHARIEIRPVIGEDYDAFTYWWSPSKYPHYLRLVAANGQVLATSETYANRRNARRAVRAWRVAFGEVNSWSNNRYRPDSVVEFDADGKAVQR